jgi:hypothetical protein
LLLRGLAGTVTDLSQLYPIRLKLASYRL